jgi:cell wall-associated NlpC family hydrolase
MAWSALIPRQRSNNGIPGGIARVKILANRWCFLAVCISLLLPVSARGAAALCVVNVPVADMFSHPTADADVVSQATYGDTVGVITQQPGWTEIRTLDDQYTGWVPDADLLQEKVGDTYASKGQVAVVEELAAHLYREPDLTKHAPVLTVPFETHLEITEVRPDGRWLKVRLVDGRSAWVQQGDVHLYPDATKIPKGSMTIPQMVAFSHRFLGLPYTWGGRSSFGYDCSGFTQMLMRQRGYSIPRDADIQAAWSGFESIPVTSLQAGDLLYFGHDGKITHTGMYIGNNQFIHATVSGHPVIQISELNDHWRKLLIAERRVKQ